MIKEQFKKYWIYVGICFAITESLVFTNFSIRTGLRMPFLEVAKYLSSPKIMLIGTVLSAVVILLDKYVEDFEEKVFRYRFFIASIVFACFVILGISGSSVGIWCSILGVEDRDVVLGVSRLIRSDEWAVSTPMLFSQYHNSAGEFPYFSDTVRAAKTDVFLEYGQPVKNILIIFRPFYMGYLFLPIANGLAFFWAGRMIVLLLVSFEFGRILTNDKRILSLAYSIMISFSPAIQWWFAINGFVEMLIAFQLSLILMRKYMISDDYRVRLLSAFGIAWCAGVYILTLYPAWQIPLGYILLGLIICMIIENYKGFSFLKKDIGIIISCITILGLAMSYFYFMSHETISVLGNTIYPGSRTIAGGGIQDIPIMFNYISNIFNVVYNTANIGGNQCETAQFISLFPLPIILACFYMIKNKKVDSILIAMIMITAFFVIYIAIGVPMPIAKLTLIGKSFDLRVMTLLGFSNIILLIRCMSLISDENEKNDDITINYIKIIVVGFLSLLTAYMSYKVNPEFLGDLNFNIYAVEIFVMFALCILSVFYSKRVERVFLFTVLVVHIISGALVNPVRMGVDSITESEVLKTLAEIEKKNPEADWLVDMEAGENDMGLLVGLDTVNCVNVYPNLERWSSIDTNRKREEIYNRYAQIKVNCNSRNTAFKLNAPDSFTVDLTDDNVVTLGVDFILTDRNYSGFNEVTRVGDFVVYSVR